MTMALVAASVVLAGCGSDQDKPRTAGTTPASTVPTPTPAATPSTTADTPTLAELARQPCLVLDQQDSVELGIVIKGSETDLNGKACQWGTAAGLVAFTPYPSVDLTADAKFRHLEPFEIDGHRAVAGTTSRGGCTTVVALGTSESFQLIASPLGEDKSAAKACPLNATFATAIIANLR